MFPARIELATFRVGGRRFKQTTLLGGRRFKQTTLLDQS